MFEDRFIERALEQILIGGGAVTATGERFLHDRSFRRDRHGRRRTARRGHERAGQRRGRHPRAGIAQNRRETLRRERLRLRRRDIGNPQGDRVAARHRERDLLPISRPGHVLDAAASGNRRLNLARRATAYRLQRQTGVALSTRGSAGLGIKAQSGQTIFERPDFTDRRQRRTFQQQ